MSDALETRYRKVLMMLPRAYRAEHAEEMLTVLMDGADPERARRKVREVLSVATFSVRLRFAMIGAAGSSTLVGDIARRAILAYLTLYLGLLVQWNAFLGDVRESFIPLLLLAGLIAALVLGWVWCGRAQLVLLCTALTSFLLLLRRRRAAAGGGEAA
jgi:hypothetical protein